jgi:hypothetical protein
MRFMPLYGIEPDNDLSLFKELVGFQESEGEAVLSNH